MPQINAVYAVADQTSSPVTMTFNTYYITDNGASVVAYTLPVNAGVGSVLKILGNSAGGWTLAQGAGQSIQFGNLSTTTGVGGSLASTNAGDCIELFCLVANTKWCITSSVGNITVV